MRLLKFEEEGEQDEKNKIKFIKKIGKKMKLKIFRKRFY